MSILLKVLGFSLSLTLLFTLTANLLPQVEGEAPVNEEVDLGTLTLDTFVQMGEKIFSGKGTCALCHNDLGRAPDLLKMNVSSVAKQRLEKERYQGAASDIESYLRESMIDPGAYVVVGFGKKGSNDTESPMPNVMAAPIQLNELEVNAVIAFLQSKDGNDVTVALPADSPKTMPGEVKEATPVTAQSAEEALNKYTCTACHAVLNSESTIGPELRTVGARMDENEIRQSIIKPNEVIAEGFAPIMPLNIAENMTVKELEMVVEFLVKSNHNAAN